MSGRVRTRSEPGSPRGQPAWGGGSGGIIELRPSPFSCLSWLLVRMISWFGCGCLSEKQTTKNHEHKTNHTNAHRSD